MDSRIAKHSIVLAGQKTSVSLEEAFWTRLKEIAERRQIRVSDLVHEIDLQRRHNNLSSAIRVFVLEECFSRRCVHCGSAGA